LNAQLTLGILKGLHILHFLSFLLLFLAAQALAVAASAALARHGTPDDGKDDADTKEREPSSQERIDTVGSC
jgi:hypothetical protein